MNQKILTLKKDATDLMPVLLTGQVMRHGELWLALPREITFERGNFGSVIFELVRSQDLQKPSQLKVILKAIRLDSLGMTLAPCLSVLSYLLSQERSIDWVIVITALLGALFFHISVNALNDVEDHMRLVDLPGTLRGSGVIQKGWMSAKQLSLFAYIALLLGTVFGLPAVLKQPIFLLGIGSAAVLGVLAYSSKPFGMKYRALGETFVFFLMGPLLSTGFALAVSGMASWPIGLIGCFFGFLSAAVLHTNNLQDIEFDRANGVATLASQLGFQTSRYFLVILYSAAFILLFMSCLFGELPLGLLLSGLLTLIPVVHLILHVFRASGPASALLDSIRFKTAKIHWMAGILACLGLLISLS